MGASSQIVAAFEAGDRDKIRQLGWWEAWEACATWWAPRQAATAKDMVPFAKLLGAEKPADVLDALQALAGEWRPTPGEIKGYLNAKRRELSTDAGRGRDRASTPEAVAAVADALRAGARPCGCGVRRSTWRIDDAGVLRCRACRGLEHGQIYAAEDTGLAP